MRKELLGEVKAELIHLMKRQGEVGVQEASRTLGLAVSTIRQHLVGLASDGWITDSCHRVGVGRPRKMYSLTPKADCFFPDQNGFLLRRLVRFISTKSEPELLEEFFQMVAQELSIQWSAQIDFLPSHRRVAAISELLEKWGYSPEVDGEHEDRLIVQFFHCPYANIVGLIDHPCQMEIDLLGHLTRGVVRRDRYMPDGDKSCRFVIDLVDNTKSNEN